MKKKVFILGISLLLNVSLAQECRYHRIKSGETIEKIAKNYGIDPKDVLKANKGLKSDNLKVGEKICIPVSKTKGKAKEDYAVYKVKKGDTLESIANKFGVDWKELKSFNNLKTTRLTEGQEIKIPAKVAGKRPQKRDQNYQTYVIQKGGRLEHLAKKLGVPEKELERLNPELKNRWLEKGTVVKVPPTPDKEGEKTQKHEIYIVKKGGRLEHVAKSLGVSADELNKLNPELKNRWLSEGTKVKVPIKRQKEEMAHYDTYVVQKSGKLEHVAKRLDLPEKDLERLNPELRNKWLKKGTIVKIPAKDRPPILATKELEKQTPHLQRGETKESSEHTAHIADVKISKNSLPMPVEGELTKSSRGVSIVAQCGAPVKAIEDGRVIYSGGDLQAYGNMVILDHGEFISLYAHNQTNLVKRGEHVYKNQEIALVGRKGNAENCALYFELRNKEGVPMDPTEYLKNAQ